MDKLITFAVPCYNSAAYMDHCVETLLAAGEDAEIILVDDGSTKDDTPAKCDAWAAKHPDIIRAIHQENGGHGEGVNQGIRNARGLYYKVVDSDDWLDTDALGKVMAKLREFYPEPFELHAVTVHPGAPGMDFGPVAALCRELNVPYHLIETEIFHIIFDLRQEKNPCSMCAKMRRGAMHSALQELGIHKVALGHHRDDAVETFFLSLFYEGRLSCFQPVTYLDRTGITQIRPLLYCGEGTLRNA